MGLIDYDLFGAKIDKVKRSVDRLKAFEPDEGYFLAHSGGKDSVTIKALADLAGVKHDAHYSLTSVDPPELVRFIQAQPITIDIPRWPDGTHMTMWNLIPHKMLPPTRMQRYCCEKLKESSGMGRVTVTGVRWAESVSRRNNRNLVDIGGKGGITYNDDNDQARRTVEQCYRTRKTIVNPIIDWTNDDVWEFIHAYRVPYCGLYDDGWKRLGCIGCPMAGANGQKRDFARWPTYERNYIHAFDKMLLRRNEKGRIDKCDWTNGEGVMRWWLQSSKTDTEQIIMELEKEPL